MIKAVIFDVDGTLLASNDAHAETFVKAFKKHNVEVSFAELKPLIGMGADDILEKFLTEDEIENFGEELLEYRTKTFLENYLPKIEKFPKLRELFEKICADGKKIALASSASEEELKEYKKKLDVSDLYEHETDSDDAEEAKPAPDIFQAALAKLKNVTHTEAIVVGDTPYDAEAAVKAKLKIIGVESGGWTKEKLIESGCSAVYSDIGELNDKYKQSQINSSAGVS